MSIKIQPPQINSASFSLSTQSPSFSSENIADIAARVVMELNLSSTDPFDDDFYSNDTVEVNQSQPSDQSNTHVDENNDDDDNDEEEESEFEFAILNSSPISADEIFSNGQIKPMFPIFNTDLVYAAHQNDAVNAITTPQTLRLPLRKLLQDNNNRNGTVSSSSSEADELEGVPPGTYCVWTPKKKEEVVQMRKKSKSTGFPSKRWRFKDLLHRSNSDGKDTFVFLTPAASKVNGNSNGNGDGKRREKSTVVKRGGMDGKKKSYLPYRQDLVGFFANVNGISRTVRPF